MPAPFNVQGYNDKVVVGDPQLDSFGEYQDAAWNQSRRYLDPQQQAMQKQFEQQAVNKGLAPGSAAYQAAYDNMMRAQNDANSSAAFGAMNFGQQAQNQAFQQGLGASQLANAMSQAQLQAETARQNAALAANTSRYGIDTSAATAAAQLAQQGQQWNDQFGFNQAQWEDQFGLQRDQFGLQEQQANFGNLLGLGNFGIQYGNYLNNAAQTDYNMAAAMLSNVPGNSQQQLNVGGAYNTAQQGAMGQAGLQQQGQQAFWGGIGDLAGAAAFLSSVTLKTVFGPVGKKKRAKITSRMINMPIYDWEYLPEFQDKDDHKFRFGPLAEDFNKSLLGDTDFVNRMGTIDVQRYVAALHMTVQDMSMEIRRLEALLWHVANRTGVPIAPDQIKNYAVARHQDVMQGKRMHEKVVFNEIRKDPIFMTEAEIKSQQGTAVVRQEV